MCFWVVSHDCFKRVIAKDAKLKDTIGTTKHRWNLHWWNLAFLTGDRPRVMKLSNKRVRERQISNAGRHSCHFWVFQASSHHQSAYDSSIPPVSSISTQLLATKDASNLTPAVRGPTLQQVWWETSPTVKHQASPAATQRTKSSAPPASTLAHRLAVIWWARSCWPRWPQRYKCWKALSEGRGGRQRINPQPSTFFAWAPHPASGVRMSHHQPSALKGTCRFAT